MEDRLQTYQAPLTEMVELGAEGLLCVSGKGDNWSWSSIEGGQW